MIFSDRLCSTLFGSSMLSSTILISLFDKGLLGLGVDEFYLDLIIDLVFSAWTRHLEPQVPRLSMEQYSSLVAPIAHAFLGCFYDPCTKDLATRKLEALSPKDKIRFASSAVFHFQQWEAVHAPHPMRRDSVPSITTKSSFMVLFYAVDSLSLVDSLNKALVKVKFWTLVPRLALRLGQFQYHGLLMYSLLPVLGLIQFRSRRPRFLSSF